MSDLRQQIAEALLQAHRDFESVPQVQRETLGTTDREALTAHQADAVVALLGLTERTEWSMRNQVGQNTGRHLSERPNEDIVPYRFSVVERTVYSGSSPWRLPTEEPNDQNL